MHTKLNLKLDDRDTEVLAEIVDKKIWFKHQGEIYSLDLLDLATTGRARTKSAAKAADKITAPMPGKITKVFVTEGQSVAKGDALLVMEAMKMEYTLKADITAHVEKILIKIQDQVALGALLVQLKEDGTHS